MGEVIDLLPLIIKRRETDLQRAWEEIKKELLSHPKVTYRKDRPDPAKKE